MKITRKLAAGVGIGAVSLGLGLGAGACGPITVSTHPQAPVTHTVTPAPLHSTAAPSNSPAPATPGPAPVPATPAPAPAAPAPAGLRDVGTGANGEQVYANANTSGEFALKVEAAYVQGDYWGQAGPSSFNVYSPVTGQNYLMTSSSTGDPVVVTGGNNALVQFSL